MIIIANCKYDEQLSGVSLLNRVIFLLFYNLLSMEDSQIQDMFTILL